MSPPGTFERVYLAIKEQLRKGVLRPGERLEPSTFCDELNASVTPIRDALHRLTGERLVEAPRHEGFRVPLVTERLLRHLYDWHLDLLLLATARKRWHEAGSDWVDPLATPGPLDRQNALFLGLARAGGNPEHITALRSLIDRMEPYQRLEEEMLDAVQVETDTIAAAVSAGDRRALRKSLIAYHRRRARLVPDLIARLQGE